MDKKNKAFLLAFSIFTVSTTIAQVISIDSGLVINKNITLSASLIKYILLIVNLSAWIHVLVVLFLLRRKGLTRYQKLSIINRAPEGEVINKKVETTTELNLVWKLDQDAYKNVNIDKTRLHDWWDKNRNGLFIRMKGGRIEASMGLWPIDKKTFEDILEGKITDVQISARDILSDSQEATSIYWYMSGLLVSTSEDIVHEFVGYGIKNFLERIDNTLSQINIAFLPMTATEVFILTPLQFSPVGTGGKLPVWSYTRNALTHLKETAELLLKSDSSINVYEETKDFQNK